MGARAWQRRGSRRRATRSDRIGSGYVTVGP